MPKILLIQTVFRKDTAVSEPLSLEQLGAYLLERGIGVRICDDSWQNVDKTIAEYQPDYIGISAVTSSVDRAYGIADRYIYKYPIIIGGIHASIHPFEALEHANWVVVGDGEEPLYSIVSGKQEHGIVGPMPMRDISSLPLPARHLVDMGRYSKVMATRWIFGKGHRTSIVMTSRGCPMRCTYCWNSTRKDPVRYQKPERVLVELEELVRKYGIRSFYFVDDDFFLPHKRFLSINAWMTTLGKIRYSVNSRATSVNEEIIAAFKNSGGELISFGFESGSQRVLDVLNKRSQVEDNEKAIKLCAKHGISVLGWIMVGNPTETVEDLKMTERFMRDNPIDMYAMNLTTAFPGTVMWEYCRENGLIPAGHKWSDYNVSMVTDGWSPNKEMSRKEIVYWFNRLSELAEKTRAKTSIGTALRMFRTDPIGMLGRITPQNVWRMVKP